MAIEGDAGAERRVQTRNMVGRWLSRCQDMLVMYCKLAGPEPYTPDKPVKDLLRGFCQVLVDYMAFGHFEIYDCIADGSERRSEVLRVAERVYSRVAEVTEVAVAFNDKYDASNHERPMNHLTDDLASRIEKEYLLVKALLR
ncbi:Rsd/AlgQ family anti-sigma factor [Candidatus Vondammii sp. HM_W22]|uniref:Rsd/AlgQ family anti-sigma factor n=1 Tax=Candidatus Vondammii sp. HM_W22 TaxID=2687299 RepID=UPI0024028FA4|nr:Rsd/AlgQ family anti-sigma factor [Candidatus Vondammii sp. HM_W22]